MADCSYFSIYETCYRMNKEYDGVTFQSKGVKSETGLETLVHVHIALGSSGFGGESVLPSKILLASNHSSDTKNVTLMCLQTT